MNILWQDHAWDDYVAWHRLNPETAQKINELVKNIRRSPFRGVGKPEPLKRQLAGFWSRRITLEHRLTYRVVGQGRDQRVEIIGCKNHYE
jgi:toxin YoeB